MFESPSLINYVTDKKEKWASDSLLARPIMSLFCKLFSRSVQEEILSAGITRGQRVLFVGGGALPYSAVLIHKLTGARVDVVDRDPRAYSLAKKLEGTLFKGYFRAQFMDGETCDPARYDTVIIARQVVGKQKLLACYREKMSHKTTLIVRTPRTIAGVFGTKSNHKPTQKTKQKPKNFRIITKDQARSQSGSSVMP